MLIIGIILTQIALPANAVETPLNKLPTKHSNTCNEARNGAKKEAEDMIASNKYTFVEYAHNGLENVPGQPPAPWVVEGLISHQTSYGVEQIDRIDRREYTFDKCNDGDEGNANEANMYDTDTDNGWEKHELTDHPPFFACCNVPGELFLQVLCLHK